MTHRGARGGGFTLIEVAIALVVFALVGAALTRLMTSQMRFFQMSSAQKAARSTHRGALKVLQNELPMVEATGGVTAATNTKLVVRLPVEFGVVCSANTISALPVDSLVYAQAVLAGYAWKDTSQSGAYTYVSSGSPAAAGTAANCSVAAVQIATLPNGRVLDLSPALPAGATTGAPVFLFQTVTYEFKASAAVPGQTALWRTVAGGSADELAVPFDTSARFRFYAQDSDTSQITVPALTTIRGVDLQLDALSERRVSGRAAPEASKLRSSVFFRNRIN